MKIFKKIVIGIILFIILLFIGKALAFEELNNLNSLKKLITYDNIFTKSIDYYYGEGYYKKYIKKHIDDKNEEIRLEKLRIDSEKVGMNYDVYSEILSLTKDKSYIPEKTLKSSSDINRINSKIINYVEDYKGGQLSKEKYEVFKKRINTILNSDFFQRHIGEDGIKVKFKDVIYSTGLKGYSKKDVEITGYYTSGFKTITLTTNIWEDTLTSILVHEFGHYLDDKYFHKFSSNKYYKYENPFYAKSWKRNTNNCFIEGCYEPKKPIKNGPEGVKGKNILDGDYVTKYSQVNEQEDFAETFRFYVMYNAYFKYFVNSSENKSKILTEKFRFMEKRFGKDFDGINIDYNNPFSKYDLTDIFFKSTNDADSETYELRREAGYSNIYLDDFIKYYIKGQKRSNNVKENLGLIL